MDFERKILLTPAFDKRHSDPHKNYGIGAMRMTFLVIGEKGAVQWMISTNWYVESARAHLANFTNEYERRWEPQPFDLGYHAVEPQYDDQSSRPCEFTPGKVCYYDGSSLQAEVLTERFLAEGEDYLWNALEAYYRCRFEDGPWPFEAEANQARARGRIV